MRNKVRIFNVLFWMYLLNLPAFARADGGLPIVVKTVTKKITIAKNVKLSIDNQYGDVEIQNWKQKTTLVQITITGMAEKPKRASALIRYINIKNRVKAGTVNLETLIDTASQHINATIGEQCHISYTVFAPRTLNLSVTNRFGNVHVKNFRGDLAIDEKFGDLKIQHTSRPINLKVEQGNADIDQLQGGQVSFKGFSSVNIGRLSGVIEARFSSGGEIGLGLSEGLQKLSVDADNVKPVNVTNLKIANADLKLHGTTSKFIYNGQILLTITKDKLQKLDTVYITGKNDTTQKINEKLLRLKKLSITAMKSVDYTLKTGTAATEIKINASFCVVNVKD